MCSTDGAPWLVTQLFILFCTAALGCNFPWVVPVPCVAWLSTVPGQRGGKAMPVLLGSVLCGRSNKLNSTKILGICLGMMLVQAEFLEVLAVGCIVNFYWVLANVWFWVYDLPRIHVIFSFSAAEGTSEYDNAMCSVNNILLFCSVSEANTSLWYNVKYFLPKLENTWLPHYFKSLLLWDPLVLLVICLQHWNVWNVNPGPGK